MGAEAAARLQLAPEQARQVRAIVDAVLPGAVVRAFGSRATGHARPFSDLDLLFVRPARLSLAERAALHDRFEASTLPFRVDLVDAEGLAAGVAARIADEAVDLR